MSEDFNRLNPNQKPAALQKLADHLAALNAQAGSTLDMESDMLSLIVSGTLHEEDVASRYPAFYQKLLQNAELRQAFLDALESIEAERAGQLIPLPEKPGTDLSFLSRQDSTPIIEQLERQNWRATWKRSFEQLQAVFSPPRLAYRADPSLLEDPWFTLLREEVAASGSTYAVALECTVSSDRDRALSAFLNLAVTVESSTGQMLFPIHADLQWGSYTGSVQISQEGRVRFPDIPLDAIYDPSQRQIQAGLSLVLETSS